MTQETRETEIKYCHAFRNKHSREPCNKRRLIGSAYCGIHRNAKYLQKFSQEAQPRIVLTPDAETDSQSYLPYQPQIVRIQAVWRGYLLRRRLKCINFEDFYTLEDKFQVAEKYFLPIEDINGYHYWLDVRTMKKVMENSELNPYSLMRFSDATLARFKRKYQVIEEEEGEDPMQMDIPLTPEKQLEFKAIDVFHKIDLLGNYTNHQWFLNLSNYELFELYIKLRHIWNYRLELSQADKAKIVSDGIAFHVPITSLIRVRTSIRRKLELQNILLDEFSRFSSEGATLEDRKYGALFILSGLVAISEEARNALPFLVDAF